MEKKKYFRGRFNNGRTRDPIEAGGAALGRVMDSALDWAVYNCDLSTTKGQLKCAAKVPVVIAATFPALIAATGAMLGTIAKNGVEFVNDKVNG